MRHLARQTNRSLHLKCVTVCALATFTVGCGHRGASTPEQLRSAYAEALARDDPDAVYDLLSPELQARTDRATFERRWKANVRERTALHEAMEDLPRARREPVLEGTSVHGHGRVLSWVRVGDEYWIATGLPGLPDTSTPAQAIRSFLQAVRNTDWSEARLLVTRDLAQRLVEDWERRADAVERALERPGAIELSADLGRAQLRCGLPRAGVFHTGFSLTG